MIIWKYQIPSEEGSFTLQVPHNARLLKVHTQYGDPMIWVLVDERLPVTQWTFEIVATGHEFQPQGWEYVDTFQHESLVWHLFRRMIS